MMIEYWKQLIADGEAAYENKIRGVVADFAECEGLRAVLIAGGSCSGKTTTTKKLSEIFKEHGVSAYVVSLDDFYRSLDESVYLPDGKRDIETVKSLRTDIMREKLVSLFNYEETSMPVFDFTRALRLDDNYKIKLEKGDILLIEGLHALNPELLGDFFDQYVTKKLYLYADAGDGVDCRLVRRVVRDARHRNHMANDTFYFWDNVRKNEREAILPYRGTADAEINTFFPFERGILDDDAVKLLGDIPLDSPNRAEADTLIPILKIEHPIPDELVPMDSLLREFM